MALDPRPPRLEEEGPGCSSRPAWRELAAAGGWVAVCTFLGAALLALPWTPAWERNHFAFLGTAWSALWLSPYFRGGISGLGLVNAGISFCELLRLMGWWFLARERRARQTRGQAEDALDRIRVNEHREDSGES